MNASLDGLIAATAALDAVDKQIGELTKLFRDTTPGDGLDISSSTPRTRQQHGRRPT